MADLKYRLRLLRKRVDACSTRIDDLARKISRRDWTGLVAQKRSVYARLGSANRLFDEGESRKAHDRMDEAEHTLKSLEASLTKHNV